MSIADLRREYNLTGLRRKDLEADPILQFQRWFEQAQGAREPARGVGFEAERRYSRPGGP